jgi:hypothetical protein
MATPTDHVYDLRSASSRVDVLELDDLSVVIQPAKCSPELVGFMLSYALYPSAYLQRAASLAHDDSVLESMIAAFVAQLDRSRSTTTHATRLWGSGLLTSGMAFLDNVRVAKRAKTEAALRRADAVRAARGPGTSWALVTRQLGVSRNDSAERAPEPPTTDLRTRSPEAPDPQEESSAIGTPTAPAGICASFNGDQTPVRSLHLWVASRPAGTR